MQDKENKNNLAKEVGPSILAGGMEYLVPGSGTALSLLFDITKQVAGKRTKQLLDKLVQKLNTNKNLPDEDKIQKFLQDIQKIPSYSELMWDYAESASRTPSSRAIDMLALLYAEQYLAGKTPDYFAIAACKNLKDITDVELETFAHLSDRSFIEGVEITSKAEEKPKILEGNGYPVIPLWKETASAVAEKVGINTDEVYSLAQRLMERSLLNPDYFVGRYGGINLPYGISQATLKYRDLWLKAGEK